MPNIIDATLEQQLESAFQCGQAGILVRSFDYEDVITTLFKLAGELGPWDIQLWDCLRGIAGDEAPTDKPDKPDKSNGLAGLSNTTAAAGTGHSATAAVQSLRHLMLQRRQHFEEAEGDLEALPPQDKKKRVLVLVNGHRELGRNCNPEKVNQLIMALHLTNVIAKGYDGHVVLLTPPGTDLPVELKEEFLVCDQELPEADERRNIIVKTTKGSGFQLPADETIDSIVDILGGLTRSQVEGVTAQSLSRFGGELHERFMWTLKAHIINSGGLMTLYRGEERFESQTTLVKGKERMIPGLGGLKSIKEFGLCSLSQPEDELPLASARGLLLLGVPGTGKSQYAKALGNETGRPTLMLNVGALMGSLVGETEANTRQALKIADAMAPCILFLDEVEKGMASGGEMNGGVSTRLFGTFLTWLADHESDVYVIATCNNITNLPPEFARAERFDAIFFMDMPTSEQRKLIWDIYLQAFQLDATQPKPDDGRWTGAEIKSCCRLARLLRRPLLQAANFVVPVAEVRAKEINKLRRWASRAGCVDADNGQHYRLKDTEKRTEKPVSASTGSTPSEVTRKVNRARRG